MLITTAHAQTLQPDELPEGVASEVPAVFYWALWIPCFCGLVWGFSVLLKGHAPDALPRPPRPVTVPVEEE